LSPNVTDIAEMARAVEGAGADALSVVNTFVGLAIDIRTRRPKLGNVTGGLSGPAIRPMAVRMVWQCAKAVQIPIVGQGGITTWRDAAESFWRERRR
jgi:dihydroorotate dehydrogenase (NAD+) catalytic subunit